MKEGVFVKITCERSKHESEDWDAVQKTFDQDLAVELGVVGYNRGGLLVEWNTLRGFVPASQLVSFVVDNREEIRRNALMERLGYTLELRVIELDLHEEGRETANWTTELLADYRGQQTGVTVTHETVRVYLHAHGYVCKRPTWTLRRKAEEKTDYVGKDCG